MIPDVNRFLLFRLMSHGKAVQRCNKDRLRIYNVNILARNKPSKMGFKKSFPENLELELLKIDAVKFMVDPVGYAWSNSVFLHSQYHRQISSV